MFDLSLFLGFAQDSAFKKELRKANPYLVSLMIGKEEYLQEIKHNQIFYLGKPLKAFPTIGQLEDFEKHLLSLLKKLTPNYPFAQNPLVVLMINDK